MSRRNTIIAVICALTSWKKKGRPYRKTTFQSLGVLHEGVILDPILAREHTSSQ